MEGSQLIREIEDLINKNKNNDKEAILSYLKYNDIIYDAPLYDDGEGYGLYELSNLLNIRC